MPDSQKLQAWQASAHEGSTVRHTRRNSVGPALGPAGTWAAGMPASEIARLMATSVHPRADAWLHPGGQSTFFQGGCRQSDMRL
jgi:hypothetical protein